MTEPDRLARRASEFLRGVSPDAAERVRREAKWRGRQLVRLAKIAGWMVGATIVIPTAMITTGVLLGPRGYEGLVAAPMAVLASWALILYLGLRARPSPRKILKADVGELPPRVEEWLQRQRPLLPAAAQAPLDRITGCLEELGPQTRGLDPRAPEANQLRRLLVDELTSLVSGFQKVPKALRRKPLHGGASPEQSLVESLTTIDQELVRVRDRLATDDLHSLATQQRYLEMKYRDQDD